MAGPGDYQPVTHGRGAGLLACHLGLAVLLRLRLVAAGGGQDRRALVRAEHVIDGVGAAGRHIGPVRGAGTAASAPRTNPGCQETSITASQSRLRTAS